MNALYNMYRVLGCYVKVIVFNTGLTPLRLALAPSPSVTALGSDAVDTAALSPNAVTTDLSFGYNNKAIL
jgi:hypothetical protein